MSDILCARRKCVSHARDTVYLETVDGKPVEVNACTGHVESLRRYIPGFNVVEKGMCVIVGCKEPRKSKGCCDNHYQHVKQWRLTGIATDFVAYDLPENSGDSATTIVVADVEPASEPIAIDEPTTTTETQQEEPTMPASNCADVTEASSVDVECDAGNPLIEAWQKAKLVPVEVMDERLAEILRLEQENTALREQLAKVQQQTSKFVLDEADLCRRYRNIVEARGMIERLDSGAEIGVTVNHVNVYYPKSDIERIKNTLRQRAEKAIEDATTLDVTVVPKDALFYLVWSPDGRTPPRYKHCSLDAAQTAAKEMRRIHGGEFYAVAVIGDISHDKEDIPF